MKNTKTKSIVALAIVFHIMLNPIVKYCLPIIISHILAVFSNSFGKALFNDFGE